MAPAPDRRCLMAHTTCDDHVARREHCAIRYFLPFLGQSGIFSLLFLCIKKECHFAFPETGCSDPLMQLPQLLKGCCRDGRSDKAGICTESSDPLPADCSVPNNAHVFFATLLICHGQHETRKTLLLLFPVSSCFNIQIHQTKNTVERVQNPTFADETISRPRASHVPSG